MGGVGGEEGREKEKKGKAFFAEVTIQQEKAKMTVLCSISHLKA